MSDLQAERTLPSGEVNRGTLYTWGAEIARTWSVEDDDSRFIDVQEPVSLV